MFVFLHQRSCNSARTYLGHAWTYLGWHPLPHPLSRWWSNWSCYSSMWKGFLQRARRRSFWCPSFQHAKTDSEAVQAQSQRLSTAMLQLWSPSLLSPLQALLTPLWHQRSLQHGHNFSGKACYLILTSSIQSNGPCGLHVYQINPCACQTTRSAHRGASIGDLLNVWCL